MKYKARAQKPLTLDEMRVFDSHPIDEKIARLLYVRGINTPEKVKQFFDISTGNLHDPYLLKGMEAAVERIERAISSKERILIIGDYDADGISSVAILYKYFLSRHAPTSYFLPDRNDDGYGLNIDLIDKLNERFSPKLIITVDCGISCPAEIAHAQKLGIDCIVTDHHVIPEKTPNCTCVNPKFTDQAYPFHDLCGAGVALKLVHALGGLEAALKYIDICAIATVADIVALRDENRAIVKIGLKKLNANSLPSVTALARSCNVHGEIRSSDISFKIGPKINASGRMGNAKRGLDIILEQNDFEIEKIIRHLADYNTRRQKLCSTIYNDVEQTIDTNKLYRNNIIVVASEKWESGVLGIVSARVTEKYGKPSIVFGIHTDEKTGARVAKGSGRSIEGIDIVRVIENFSDMVLTFGGHAMAAGLSVSMDNYDAFRDKIVKYVNDTYSAVTLSAEKAYDFDIDFEDITPEFASSLEMIEPTGCENPLPTFMTTVTQCIVGALNNYPIHLRFTYNNMQFIFFNGYDCGDVLAYNFPKQILFEFQKSDEFNSVKGVCKDIIPVPTDPKSYALTLSGYLQQIFTYTPDMKMEKILTNLSVDREIFVEYYKFMKNGHGSRCFNVFDLFVKLDTGAFADKYDLYQFAFCATVFKQLGILSFAGGIVKINATQQCDLFAAAAYNIVREYMPKTPISEKTLVNDKTSV